MNDGAYDVTDPSTCASPDDVVNGYGGTNTQAANAQPWTNAKISMAIDTDDTDLFTVQIPLTSITLEPNGYYTLNFYFNMAIDADEKTMIFDGAGIE